MKEFSIKELSRRFEIHFNDRKGSVEDTWDLIERYIAPMRGGKFFQPQQTESELTFRRPELFSTTAIAASHNLASSLHGNLTSSTMQWFEFHFRDPKAQKNTQLRQWIEDRTARVFTAILDSNFDPEVSETYLDMVHFGNGSIDVDVAPGTTDQMMYSAIPTREFYFEMDHRNRVQIRFRLRQWTPTQIMSFFEDKPSAKIPESVRKAYETDPNTAIDIVQAVYYTGKASSRAAAAKDRPYRCEWFKRDTAESIYTTGYYEMPTSVARWGKISGSRWGYGPSTLALPHVLTLNSMTELVLDNAEKAISPPLVGNPNGIFGPIDVGPDGYTPMMSPDMLQYLETRSRFDVSAVEIARLEEQIEALFLVDRLDLKESPEMTATEVNARVERMARLLGATLSRIMTELLVPVIERTASILDRAGKLPPAPEVTGADLSYDIFFTGPLPRAVRREQSISLLGLLDSIAQAGQVMPELQNAIHPVRFSQYLTYASGAPADVLRTEDELEELEKKEQQDKDTEVGIEMAKAGILPEPGGIVGGLQSVGTGPA